jgi:uncharacterized protein YifE (UPF0438 family)
MPQVKFFDIDEYNEIMAAHRTRMEMLASGGRDPQSENEMNFVQFVGGKKIAESAYEKAWERHKFHQDRKPLRTGPRYLQKSWGDHMKFPIFDR